jgi:RimJ/RimL family protein N-acetyltransferase
MLLQEIPMIEENFLFGKRVKLTVEEVGTIAETFSRWQRDSEYNRLLSTEAFIPHSVKANKEWLEKNLEKAPPEFYLFMIRRMQDDRLIGEIGLDGVKWNHGESFVGISIGEREFWGNGYGTEAMELILRFAFLELNLHRVSLDVFDYNPRAIRSYEKAGFIHEGRQRGSLKRDGHRYDMLYMGILREEWLAKKLVAEKGLNRDGING